MPEIPEEAVQAAAEAIKGEDFMAAYSVLAYAALEAAAPLIAEQARAEERARIVAWLRFNPADIDVLRADAIERGDHAGP